MKKLSVKILSLCLTLTLLLGVSGIAAFAAPASTMNVTLRVEGMNKNLFYKTEQVPYTDTLTLQAALKTIDEQESGLTLTGVDSSYITAINGETAGKFGGYDGWLFRVNGLEPTVGISDYVLKDGDSVVLYYGDPYGVGFQYPTADTSKLADGVLKFTSADTSYVNNNPVVTVNPVAGAKVTWSYGGTSAVYTTDKDGAIKIDPAQLTAGAHSVQIAKSSDAGLPLALRFAPDYAITVAQSSTTTAATTATAATAATTAATHAGNPGTGEADSPTAVVFVLSLTAAAAMLTIIKGRKSSYEK